MRTVEYAYDVGDRVLIRAIELEGVVDGLMTDGGGASYRVVYWNDGERHVEVMYGCEVGAVRKREG